MTAMKSNHIQITIRCYGALAAVPKRVNALNEHNENRHIQIRHFRVDVNFIEAEYDGEYITALIDPTISVARIVRSVLAEIQCMHSLHNA